MSHASPRPDDRTQYGGQAVVEGVMMRSPHYYAVACRRLSNSEIVTHLEPVQKSMKRWMWLNRPFLRGTLALIDAFILGYRSLTYAANIAAADQLGTSSTRSTNTNHTAPHSDDAVAEVKAQPINGIAIGATSVIAVCFGTALFWILPAAIADHWAHHHSHKTVLAAVIEGAIRIAFFLGYISLIAQMKNIQRVFQYHGAEHKAINTLESGLPLTLGNAKTSSRIHPRCGTNFIFIVLITATIIFGFVPRHSLTDGIVPFFGSHLIRIALLIPVAGISFEILKLAGANRNKSWVRAIIAPGLWLQYMTTRVPDDAQIEVALASLQTVWDAEHKPAASSIEPNEEPSAAVA